MARNLIGWRFGRLTVVTESPHRNPRDPQIRWICRCDCGNVTETTGGNLRSGNTKSCGCLKLEFLQIRNLAAFNDITGRTFGRLTVRGFAGRVRSKALWRCSCACGREVLARQENLISGGTTSCGCYGRALIGLRMKAFSAVMKHISTSPLEHAQGISGSASKPDRAEP
jgi:hypothetical protein